MKKTFDIKKVLVAVFLIFFVLWTLFPFYWILVTSLKTSKEIIQVTPTFWPTKVTFEHYVKMLTTSKFGTYIMNSVKVTMISSCFILVISILGGYALARYKFRGQGLVMGIMLASQMISGMTIIIPLFRMFSKLGILDSHWSLIIAYTVGNIPFCLITMSSFFQRIPKSLEEAAMIDGCSSLGAVRRVILPVMRPGIVATFVFAFTGCWNEFFTAMMFMSRKKMWTIPIGLDNFCGKFNIDWGQMAAASVVALIPVIIMFALVQKHIVAGLTSGAVKE